MPDTLRDLLFPHDGEHTYAVIDGASCEDLLEKLDELAPRHYCLYAGEIEPDVEEVAPYVVELLETHPFTEWFLTNALGQHWGIFARSPLGLRAMRKHFRTFLLVKSPANVALYFRFYDPRVLRNFLPTCLPKELAFIFGPTSAYMVEESAALHAVYQFHGGRLETRFLEAQLTATKAKD